MPLDEQDRTRWDRALNRAVAAAMAYGPAEGLRLLEPLAERRGEHHRLHAVRAQELIRSGSGRGRRNGMIRG